MRSARATCSRSRATCRTRTRTPMRSLRRAASPWSSSRRRGSDVATAATSATAGSGVDDPSSRHGRPPGGWRLRLYKVIFESDTRAGRTFDLILIWLILTSVAVVMIDSFESMHERWGATLTALEWAFTVIFTIEY